jgi:hypothetical protein
VSRVRVAEALLRRRRPPLVVCCSCYSGVDIAWLGGWVRSGVVMSEGIERRILAVAWRGTLCFRRTEPQRKCVGGGGGDE